MGAAGRSFVEYGTDRACPSGQFPSGKRVGAVHGRGDPGGERSGPSYRIFALGQTGPDEKITASQSETSDSGSTPSKPLICLPWIFRLQTFQSGK